MVNENPQSWISESDKSRAIALITQEAQNTISLLVWHIRMIAATLTRDRDYIEFLYQNVYLPHRQYFDEIMRQNELDSIDGHELLVEFVGGITEAFVYARNGYEDQRFSMGDDSTFWKIKLYNKGNLDYWMRLWWVEASPERKIPKPALAVFDGIRRRIRFLSEFSTKEPQEEIHWHRLTAQWRFIYEQYMKVIWVK